jgi:hypothetical protein
MKRRLVTFIGLCLTLAGATLLYAQKKEKPVPIARFQCFAASLGTGATGVVDITLYRWTTDEERDMLLTTLQEFGEDKLLDALQKIRPPVGYMRTPNSLGYDLYYARRIDNPDGSYRIVMGTNRRVAFREAANNTRSMQYQFNVIELHLDKEGKGDGKMVPMAKITWDTKAHKLEIENYNALPVDLINVKAQKV